MTDTPYSDQLPTRRIIQDLLRSGEHDEETCALRAELAEAKRRERVLLNAVKELDHLSLRSMAQYRDADPAYASGYEQGMVDALQHVLSAHRRSDRNRVIETVRGMLTEAGLDGGG